MCRLPSRDHSGWWPFEPLLLTHCATDILAVATVIPLELFLCLKEQKPWCLCSALSPTHGWSNEHGLGPGGILGDPEAYEAC